EGICRLTAGYLSGPGGITNLDAWVTGHVRLYNQGSEIPVYVYDEGPETFGTNDYIEFYAARVDTPFTDKNVYWMNLATNAGARIAQVARYGGVATSNYACTVRLEEQVDYIPDIPDETPDDDHWFMLELYDGQTNDFEVNLPDVDAVTDDCSLRIEMQGLTAAHHAQVQLNGAPVGALQWNGYEKVTFATNVSQALLLDGTNVVTVGIPGDTGAPWEDVLINWIEFTYTRQTKALNDALAASPAADGAFAYELTGFDTPDVAVYEIVSATNITRVTNVVVSGTGPYTVHCSVALQATDTLMAVGDAGVMQPLYIWEDATSDLRSTTNGADYIIITYDPWKEAVETLADHRRGEGMRARVVGVQDVYDDFSYGLFTPYAIQDFLKYARAYWQSPAPTYVLLVGDGTYDYRDYYGLGDVNYVPTKLLHGLDYGETASDNWLVCLDDDTLPDMYVGRMPARTTNDVETMVGKVIGYEALSPEGWMTNLLLVSDVEDGATSFEHLNEAAAAHVPESMARERIRLANYTNLLECKADVLDAFNDGYLAVSYAGHGSTEQWADPPTVFENSDLPDLNNADRLPLVITPTCMNGYFIWPQGDGYECLGEELARTNGRGAVACLSPSAFGLPPNQQAMVERVFDAIFAVGQTRMGPAMSQAKFDLAVALGGEADNLLNTFILFGDPALRLQYQGVSDTTTPTVVSWSPEGALHAGTSTSVRITFSEAMDDIAVRAAFRLSPTRTGQFHWEGDTLVFTPAQAWDTAATYTVDLLAGATDRAGNPMESAVQFSFTPAAVTVAGHIAYTGTQHGIIWVIAVSESDAWHTNLSVALSDLGAYSLSVPGQSNWYIKAFRDANKNFTCDTWEAQGVYALNPLHPVSDVDGIDLLLTDPPVDTDGDSLTDFQEVNVYATNPFEADGDEDGLNDAQEIFFKTAPDNPDTDGDGMLDGDEVIAGTSPLNGAEWFRIASGAPMPQDGIVFEWASVLGRRYTVQGGAGYQQGTFLWSNLLENLNGTGGSMVYSNTAGSPWAVFRLIVTTNSP
ncbi:MAG: hypothetical protein EOM20_14275, partial [Spartobacteria bacterium]|nr:hypothetical protein [Spartobacteria bacterium]